MSRGPLALIRHYYNLLYFSLYRFRGDNYEKMRRYFAEVLISEIEEYTEIDDKEILDVGGSRGEFCEVLSNMRQCDPINLDPCPGDPVWKNTIIGRADSIPFEDGRFDIVISRGVLEHIPREYQQASLDDMFRVLKRGGVAYLMIPPWYNPHAGHGMKPFHYFPFKTAKRLREFFFKKRVPENSYEEKRLFPITFSRMRKMVERSGFSIIGMKDTHFRMHFMAKIPVLREICIPSVAFIVRKPYE